MAEKIKTEKTTDTTAAEETPAAEESMPVDEWQEMLEVTIPRQGKNDEKALFVCINGRTFQIPKGKRVQVPFPVYERVQIMLAAQRVETEFRETEIPHDEQM